MRSKVAYSRKRMGSTTCGGGATLTKVASPARLLSATTASSQGPGELLRATDHVVVLTTTDDETEIQKCYDLGANVNITKPVDYEGFATAIRNLGLFFSVIQVP